MEYLLFLIVILGLLAFGFLRLFKRSRGPAIDNPVVGFHDASNGEFSALLSEDKTGIAPLFAQCIESNTGAPRCNVLFLYCQIEEDGKLRGSNFGLRELIRDSGALVVVVATNNPGAHYRAAAKKTGYGFANLVMTLDRKGPSFQKFFQNLFGLMKRGKSMPMAWVKLAPQIPGESHTDCPDSIFSCEAGHVRFR